MQKLKSANSRLIYKVKYLEITCPYCNQKFVPRFVEDNYMSGYGDDAIPVEDESCFCPHCNQPVYRSEIDECEEQDLALEDAKKEHPEFFDDEDESGKEQETEESPE